MAESPIAKQKTRMPLGMRKTFEFTLPQSAKKRVTPGDFFRVEKIGPDLVLRPVDEIDPSQAWFWTSEWQGKEQEAQDDIARGRISGPFRTARGFMHHLK